MKNAFKYIIISVFGILTALFFAKAIIAFIGTSGTIQVKYECIDKRSSFNFRGHEKYYLIYRKVGTKNVIKKDAVGLANYYNTKIGDYKIFQQDVPAYMSPNMWKNELYGFICLVILIILLFKYGE